jgi:hypothetical protein
VRISRWAGILATASVLSTLGMTVVAGASQSATSKTFLHNLNEVSQVGSTVPANGDVNPYGVAVVTSTVGKLVSGSTLVSNFNSKANVQGTGTTIVEVAPSGQEQLFSQISQLPAGDACPGGIGLSTALDVLPGGWVVVGSLPTGAGGALPKEDPVGCLIVLNSNGAVAETISNSDIVGPWDMTAQQTPGGANLFVSNALGGNTKTDKGVPVAGSCTIVRLSLKLSTGTPPALLSSTVVGDAYPWKANMAALVLAPTGVALGSNGTLYVDNSLNNTVSAIRDAATRTTPVAESASIISKGGSLDAPLGLVLVPNGDLLVVNGNNGVATELSPGGKQVATKTLVKKGAGDLFGLSVTPNGQGIYFVNDGTNALDLAQHKAG